MDTNTERYTRTLSIPGYSSKGGTTRNSVSVLYENTLLSERRYTSEHQTTIQNLIHTNVLRVQSESRLALIVSESSHLLLEPYARSADRDLVSDGTPHSTPNVVGYPLNYNELPIQVDPILGDISILNNNEPFNAEDSQALAILRDDSNKDSKDEPDYRQIIRDLRRLKHRRKL